MSINEVAGAIGDWTVKLRGDTPKFILDGIDYWGHIAYMSGKIERPERYGDGLLDEARYVGVLRDREFDSDDKSIGGGGQALWLGDEDGKGKIVETAINIVSADLIDALTAVLPPSITPGTIEAMPGPYTDTRQYETRRQSVDYITSVFEAEWRIRGDGTLDAGSIGFLYPSEPTCAIVRRIPDGGIDMSRRVLPGQAKLQADVQDFTTRVFLMAQAVEGDPPVIASADIAPGLNPYLDIHGNPLEMTRLVSDSQTTADNAPAVAQLVLNRFTKPREAIGLTTFTHDIKGDLIVGGNIWVEDADAKLYDPDFQIKFKGMTLNPVKLRVSALSYPVEAGNSVFYRHWNGTWIDLTPYVEFESGQTTVTVNGYNRSLTGAGQFQQPVGSVGGTNTTIPDVPTWNTPFRSTTYTSATTGLSRAQFELSWNQPLNTIASGGGVITDGGWYEIRYRRSSNGIYPATYDEMHALTNDALHFGTNDSPITFTQGAWVFTRVPWGEESLTILDLEPGMPYDFEIRAADNFTPTNFGDWSSTITAQTRFDSTAPNVPNSADQIAANTLSVQIIHNLGTAGSGGDFNLNADLNHLNVWYANEPTFSPDFDAGTNKLGEMPATLGMMLAHSPAIKTFNIEQLVPLYFKFTAVDNYGNESLPSEAVQQTAELVDDAHISNLIVSKILAGSVITNWIQSADFRTAASGQRAGFSYAGFYAFNALGNQTFSVDSSTGVVTAVGSFIVKDYANPGDEIVISPSISAGGGAGLSFPTITLTDNNAAWPNPAYINALAFGGSGTALGLNSGPSAASSPANQSTIILTSDYFNMMYNTLSPTPNITKGAEIYGDINTMTCQYFNSTTLALRGEVYSTNNECGMIHHDTAGASKSWAVADETRIRLGVLAADVFVGTTGVGGYYVTAVRYCSSGEGNFYGQMGQDASPGDVFNITNNSADASNPAMFAGGFAGRFIKSFVIDHPTDKDRYLVHGCTESPVAGVEYSGIVEVHNFGAVVELPGYFESEVLKEGRTVQLTILLPDDDSLFPYLPRAIAGLPIDGKFRISTDAIDGARISWLVKGTRADVPQFEVEPLKSKYDRKGSGPYTYLVEK